MTFPHTCMQWLVVSKVLHAHPIEYNPYPHDDGTRKDGQCAIISTHPQCLIAVNNLLAYQQPRKSTPGMIPYYFWYPPELVSNSTAKHHKPFQCLKQIHSRSPRVRNIPTRLSPSIHGPASALSAASVHRQIKNLSLCLMRRGIFHDVRPMRSRLLWE
jgi:hypothetical protein